MIETLRYYTNRSALGRRWRCSLCRLCSVARVAGNNCPYLDLTGAALNACSETMMWPTTGILTTTRLCSLLLLSYFSSYFATTAIAEVFAAAVALVFLLNYLSRARDRVNLSDPYCVISTYVRVILCAECTRASVSLYSQFHLRPNMSQILVC